MTGSAVQINALSREGVKSLVEKPGPCVSIYWPRYAPGAATKPASVWLKGILADTRAGLELQHFPAADIAQLMEPIEDMENTEEINGGHRNGEVWFRTPDTFQRFQLPLPVGQGFALGQQPYLLPLLSSMVIPSEFYILGLAKEAVALFRCEGGACAPVDLPATVPRTMNEAMQFEPLDHDLDNQAPSGTAPGQRHTVHFGAGDEGESEGKYLHQFFRILDTRVGNLLRGRTAPVVLAGVRYEMVDFLKASRVLNLIRAQFIEGGWRDLSPEVLHDKGAAVVKHHYCLQIKELTNRLLEAPGRRVLHVNDTLRAALEGRVWKLFVAEEKPEAFLAGWRENLELNRVVAESLRNGGEVFVAKPADLPSGARVAALLRY